MHKWIKWELLYSHSDLWSFPWCTVLLHWFLVGIQLKETELKDISSPGTVKCTNVDGCCFHPCSWQQGFTGLSGIQLVLRSIMLEPIHAAFPILGGPDGLELLNLKVQQAIGCDSPTYFWLLFNRLNGVQQTFLVLLSAAVLFVHKTWPQLDKITCQILSWNALLCYSLTDSYR